MLLSLFLPWKMRRLFLERQFGYEIHPTCQMGFSCIFPARLIMEEGSCIDGLQEHRSSSLETARLDWPRQLDHRFPSHSIASFCGRERSTSGINRRRTFRDYTSPFY